MDSGKAPSKYIEVQRHIRKPRAPTVGPCNVAAAAF